MDTGFGFMDTGFKCATVIRGFEALASPGDAAFRPGADAKRLPGRWMQSALLTEPYRVHRLRHSA